MDMGENAKRFSHRRETYEAIIQKEMCEYNKWEAR